MKKASWSLAFVLLASLISLDAFAQRNQRQPREPRRPDPAPMPLPHSQEEVLSERVQQTLRTGQRLRLAQVLRAQGQRGELVSLSIVAQSFQGPGKLHLMREGLILETIKLRRQLAEIPVLIPGAGKLQELELSANEEIYIESISATIRLKQEPRYERERQVSPHTLLTVRLNQDIINGEVPLKRLVKEQLGLSLEGAQIERVAVEGMPLNRAASAVHVEINNRIASPVKYLSAAQRRTPLNVTSLEEVKTLRLVVSGPARIMDINIRVGAVRPEYNPAPVPARIFVNREVSPAFPLDLAQFTRGFSVVSTLVLETSFRGYSAGEIILMNRFGHMVGRGFAQQGRTMIHLTVPTSLSDIRVHTQSQIFIGSIE